MTPILKRHGWTEMRRLLCSLLLSLPASLAAHDWHEFEPPAFDLQQGRMALDLARDWQGRVAPSAFRGSHAGDWYLWLYQEQQRQLRGPRESLNTELENAGFAPPAASGHDRLSHWEHVLEYLVALHEVRRSQAWTLDADALLAKLGQGPEPARATEINRLLALSNYSPDEITAHDELLDALDQLIRAAR